MSVLRADLPPVVAELRRAVDNFKVNLQDNKLLEIGGGLSVLMQRFGLDGEG